MNPIELLEREHEDIDRELIELEAIMQENSINYPNLVHVFKRLHDVWNEHEEKEEKLFKVLEKEEIRMPVEKMLFEHKELGTHKRNMLNAINSGSEFEMKKALESSGKVIVEKLRKHIQDEEGILFLITLDIFSPKELRELGDSIK